MPSPVTIDRSAVRWSSPTTGKQPLLLLLHGRGADETDLFGLVPHLPEQLVVASLRAPHREGPGYSWVPPPPAEATEPPEGAVDLAVAAVLGWVDAVAADGPVGLLGFSQGGAMALQLNRARPGAFAASLVLSGFVFDGEQPGDAVLRTLRPPVFWGRGTLDDVIEVKRIDRTARWLAAHASLEERRYPVGHSISLNEVRDVCAFLGRALAS